MAGQASGPPRCLHHRDGRDQISMARYYFHFSTGESLVDDNVGEEFATPERAHAYGTQVASELARNRSGPYVSCHLVVMDETGLVIFNIPVVNGDTG
jgi:hypothetical protein